MMNPETASILQFLAPASVYADLGELRDRLLRASAEDNLTLFLSLTERLCQPAIKEAGRSAYYALFAGAIALDRKNLAVSRFYLEQARLSFHRENDFYHEALTVWLAGLTYDADQKLAEAQQCYEQAIKILEQWGSLEDKSGSTKNGTYTVICQQLGEAIHSTQQRMWMALSVTEPDIPIAFSFLSWPSFPLYATVQAGPNGPAWGDIPPEGMVIDLHCFQIDSEVYRIFSVKRGDRRVSLQRDRQYGWIWVQGDSMNAAEPVPIVEGDLALFYAAADATENDFVVISYPESAGPGYKAGYQYMIKRWRASQNVFLSESLSGCYPSIPRDEDHRILGVVVAIAKPISSLSSQESIQRSGGSSPWSSGSNRRKQEERGMPSWHLLSGGRRISPSV